jgi:hypothetical protein
LYDSRDAITAVATAFIAFFTFTLWSSTSGLVEAAKIQSRDMKASIAVSAISNELALKAISADQRPWLEPYGPTITGFKPGKTHLGIDGFYMNISLIAINRGRAPATNVHFNAEIYLSGPNRPQSQERLETFASEWRGQNISPLGAIFRDGQLAMGHTLFLGQPEIDKVLASQTSEFKIIAPYVIGCITYGSAHFNEPQQTNFAYALGEIREGNAFVIQPTKPQWWEANFALLLPGIVIAT